MILFSDLHLKAESKDVVKSVLFELHDYALSHHIRTIACLGDFWHIRYNIPVDLQNLVVDWLYQLWQSKIEFIIIPGNHDQIDMAGNNALEVFHAYPNVSVYSDPHQDKWGLWIPYRKSEDVVKSTLATFPKTPFVFAHLPVRGAAMNNNILDVNGMPMTIFRGRKRVMLGHYHKRQTFVGGMASYIGSPYQTRADEYGQTKGFAVFNRLNGSLVWENRIWGKRWHRVEGDPHLINWSEINSGDVVKIIVPTDKDVSDVQKKTKVYASTVSIHVEAEKTEAPGPRFGLTKGTTMTGYAQAWIKYKQETEPDDTPHPKELLDFFEHLVSS